MEIHLFFINLQFFFLSIIEELKFPWTPMKAIIINTEMIQMEF